MALGHQLVLWFVKIGAVVSWYCHRYFKQFYLPLHSFEVWQLNFLIYKKVKVLSLGSCHEIFKMVYSSTNLILGTQRKNEVVIGLNWWLYCERDFSCQLFIFWTHIGPRSQIVIILPLTNTGIDCLQKNQFKIHRAMRSVLQ